MGDSGSEDTSDSLTESDLDQIASDAEDIQEGGKSNIVGSSSYDAQFTADNLESRGLDPENFMAPENFAQTTQGGFTGGTGPQETTINVPSVGAADTTSTFGQSANIFDPDLATMTGRRDTAPRGLETGVVTPEARGIPSFDAFGNPVTLQSFAPANVTKTNLESPSTQAAIAATLSQLDQNRNRRAGLGDPRGIDFGVTQQLLPTAPPPRPVDQIAAMTMPGTAMGTIPTEEIGDLADTEFAIPGGTQTTATGTTRGEDPFDPNVGLPFPVETLERAERLVNEKTALENLGIPSFLSAVDPERISRDLMATSLIAGRPISAVEAIRGVQAPNLQKETMEEYRERTGARIPESQIITDDSGLVVGIKDAQGNLVTGMDPNAREEQGDGGEQVTKAPPKAPTDPCPDGYQLIDGKCTPTGATDTGTGFMMFPADRDPAFRRGPFTPTTVATNPNIQALNPVTFGLSNIFRR